MIPRSLFNRTFIFTDSVQIFGRLLSVNVKSLHVKSLSVKSLNERGLISNVFPEINEKFVERIASKKVSIYAGFDPTASSLHLGNLLVFFGLFSFQRSGIKPVIVIGGATALIGDPSGKINEREKISSEKISQNSEAIHKQIDRIFANHATYFWKSQTKKLPSVTVLNNMEWYERLNPVEFLGGVGRHIRMGGMLLKDSVQTRLNSPDGMSFAEFSYQAFQAYDWLHLFKNHDCFLQIGGNDQMGNMTAGYELIRRVTEETPHCFTMPLVTSETGDKFGKTAGNAIWLDEEKTSAFEFYQFFLRLPDTEVEKYLRLLTFLAEEEIANIMTSHWSKPELRKPHKKLAEQVTLLVHGEKGVELAKRATDAFFNSDVKALAALDPEVISTIFGKAFVCNLSFTPGITVLDVVMKAKCFLEERDARRVIGAGGVYLNFQKMQNSDQVLQIGEHLLPNDITLIRIGKKNYYVVRWNT